MMDFVEDDHPVTVEYVNDRGEKSTLKLKPISLRCESDKWHSQWWIEALDLESGFVSNFTLKNMKICCKEES